MPGRWVVDDEEGGEGEAGVSWVFVDGEEGDADLTDDACDFVGGGALQDAGQGNGYAQDYGFELPSRTTRSVLSTALSIPAGAQAQVPAWDAGYGLGYDTDSPYVPLSKVMSAESGDGMLQLQPALLDDTVVIDLPSPAASSCAFSDLMSPAPSASYSISALQADNVQRKALRRRRSSRAESFHSAMSFDQTFVHPLSGLSLVMGYNTSLPKSRLDAYITAMRQLVLSTSEQGLLT